jgi:transcriptional regulator with XRE-family HTH domain
VTGADLAFMRETMAEMTVEALADALGLSAERVEQYERGEVMIPAALDARIYVVFDREMRRLSRRPEEN